jgi:hypothetical protein
MPDWLAVLVGVVIGVGGGLGLGYVGLIWYWNRNNPL